MGTHGELHLCNKRCYRGQLLERGDLVAEGGSHFLTVVFQGAVPEGNLHTQGENASKLIADSGTNSQGEYTALYRTALGKYFKIQARAGQAYGTRLSTAVARPLFDLLGRQGRQLRYAFDLKETQDKVHIINEYNLQERSDREAQEEYEDEHRNEAYDWFHKPGEGIHL